MEKSKTYKGRFAKNECIPSLRPFGEVRPTKSDLKRKESYENYS